MDNTRLAEIRARCEAATPGPWSPVIGYIEEGYSTLLPTADDQNPMTSADQAFIGHARTDIPDLLSALEASERERDVLREVVAAARKALKTMEKHRQQFAGRGRRPDLAAAVAAYDALVKVGEK